MQQSEQTQNNIPEQKEEQQIVYSCPINIGTNMNNPEERRKKNTGLWIAGGIGIGVAVLVLIIGGTIAIKGFNRAASKASKVLSSINDANLSEAEKPITDAIQVREFLDEYESVINECTDLLEKYKDDPKNVSILAQFADLTKKCMELASRAEGFDTSQMTSEDAKYFLEVTTRCTEKMLKVIEGLGGNGDSKDEK